VRRPKYGTVIDPREANCEQCGYPFDSFGVAGAGVVTQAVVVMNDQGFQ